ncbi:DUF2909 domain-containing protein [Paenalcaligenes niemegkensis]|uniref:DUF2909 domain-containing protein n=1 Tax=Paenalcaligenes niemegkensis TaxID=2895469 RepID=UPI001EE903E8|nr:DUF2909 domain-containing protein [Paenalcaligenes niemegkensis]MCQ9617722.1 DUF2909 domain-containing protein [Paenalcaligenes niemegkensis]
MHVLIVVMFFVIILSMAVSLVFLLKDKQGTNNLAVALTWRVGLSIALFLGVLGAHALGWLPSTGFP